MSGAAASQGLVLGRFWTGGLVGPLVGGRLARELAQRLVVTSSGARGEYDRAGMLQRRCYFLLGGGGSCRNERGGDSGVRVSVCVWGWWAQVVVSSIVQQQAGRQAEPKQARSKQQVSKRKRAREWIDRGDPVAAWCNRVCIRRGCVRAGVYFFLTLCQHTFRSLYRFLSQSLDLPALSLSHTHTSLPRT